LGAEVIERTETIRRFSGGGGERLGGGGELETTDIRGVVGRARVMTFGEVSRSVGERDRGRT
jgi:hypothetical protein